MIEYGSSDTGKKITHVMSSNASENPRPGRFFGFPWVRVSANNCFCNIRNENNWGEIELFEI